MRHGEKIFGIGLQKTGLTSLLQLMKSLDLRAKGHNSKMRRKLLIHNDIKSVLDYYDTGDFFCDWPTPLMYKLAYRKYGPQSRYVLTVRRDAKTWFESIKRHNAYAHPILNKHSWVFGSFYPHGYEAEHIAYYEQHCAGVEAFFKAHNALDQLLVLRVDEPGAVKKLATFLDVAFPLDDFPHENRSLTGRDDISSTFKRHYNRVVQPVYGYVAPRLRLTQLRQVKALDDALYPSEIERGDTTQRTAP